MNKTIEKIVIDKFCERIENELVKETELLDQTFYLLKTAFQFSNITIDFNSSTLKNNAQIKSSHSWQIPADEEHWLLNQFHNHSESNIFYIKDRSKAEFTNKKRIKLDQKKYKYECKDILYWILRSDDGSILGYISLSNWSKNEQIWQIENNLGLLKKALHVIQRALDNLNIHNRIERLLSDKKQLKKRIQEDEDSLKRRILELTVLYDSSNLLGYSFDRKQIVDVTMESLLKVLNLDICSIVLLDFVPESEIYSVINYPLNDEVVKELFQSTLSSIQPFTQKTLSYEKTKIIKEIKYQSTQKPSPEKIHPKSFANVPLIFKDEVIGLLNVCSTTKSTFSRNEMTFIHTMANQLASHLGRLMMMKETEKSKINSLILSMNDGIILINKNDQIEIINPAAENILKLEAHNYEDPDAIIQKFKELGLYQLYVQAIKRKKNILDNELLVSGQVYSVSISEVKNIDKHPEGTVIIIRNITEAEKDKRIKMQRLDMINKVDSLINSISDLDNLLKELMNIIMSISCADNGSIQILDKQSEKLFTQVHSNFPDKIRDQYQYKNRKKISDVVLEKKRLIFIPDYNKENNVVKETKILIKSYLAIPIISKDELLGIISIIIKPNNKTQLTDDDIITLQTIASLTGTAIQNAFLYKETMSKQQLEQELKVAYNIQKQFLPNSLPVLNGYSFGAQSIPAREIGGDYYDYFYLNDNHIGILLADIVGKGIPAGLFMATLKSILHSNIGKFKSPKDALIQLNQIIYEDPVISKFIPVFYAILNTENNELTYCNAGHEPAIYLSNGICKKLDTEGFPLGGIKNTEFVEKKVKLNPNDLILMFTDGVIESKNKSGAQFGLIRLKQYLKNNYHKSCSTLIDGIHKEVLKFSNNRIINDDFTVFTFKRHKRSHKISSLIDEHFFEVSSATSNVKTVRATFDKIFNKYNIAKSIIFDIKLAVDEAQSNVIEHVYFGNPNEKISFHISIYTDKIKIRIIDYGHSVKQMTTKSNKKDLVELEGSGLGLFLMGNLMDEFYHEVNDSLGNQTVMIKKVKIKQP